MADSNLKVFNGEKIDMFWWPRESGSKGYKCVNGDSGNAMGAYQFDRRYALVPFMQFCVDYNAEKYVGFKKFIAYGAGSEKLKNNQELANLWLGYCNEDLEEFGDLQDQYAYKYYYLSAKNYAVKKGVPVDNYSPVLKGSLWSFAIRSGSETGAKKVVSAYNNGNRTELKLLKASYNTYGSQDANRWNISAATSQYADAIRIYKEKYVADEEMYRVGTDWKDGKCVDQKGAYTVLENAKKSVDELGDFYKVFDKSGKVVYELKQEETKAETSANEEMYRVGTDWKDGKCVDQKGAYTVLENAKNSVDSLGTSYKVFNESGKIVYELKQEETKVETPVVDEKKEEEKDKQETSTTEYPDKENWYKVCTGWKSGHTVGQMGSFTIYNNAKQLCIKLASQVNKTYYVYTAKGVRLFMSNPNSTKKDVVNGYKVGTACNGSTVVNQKGAFTKFENAKNFANTLSKQTGVSYKVYLNGELQHTGTTK